jgi:copper(I)-binding protein
MMPFGLFAMAWAALATPAAAHEKTAGDLVIEHPYARATAAVQKNGAVYMVIRNRGNEPERLLAVRTVEAQSAGLHSSTINAEGIARMQPVETLEIPPGSETKLTPAGLHIMLVGLKTRLFEGTIFPMTLAFERAGEVELEVMVEGMGAGTGSSGSDTGHAAGHEP